MREKEFINIIQDTLNSDYIGDDCAYLKNLGIVITQDNLVEDIHFLRNFITPYQLGYKSVMVNISDVCASGAKPEYLTVGLSLPDDIDCKFIEEFYRGAKEASGDVKIVGGDITGADKIFISVSAIGTTKGRNISSRSKAKEGQKIVISGNHGSSAAGLNILTGEKYPEINQKEKSELILSHLMPQAQTEFSKRIAILQKGDYAMMDTSDGLADALSQISEASNVMVEIYFDKIPHKSFLEKISDYKNLILYGAEDYGLVATVDNPTDDMTIIGQIKNGSGIKINYQNSFEYLNKEDIEKNIFKHFKD